MNNKLAALIALISLFMTSLAHADNAAFEVQKRRRLGLGLAAFGGSMLGTVYLATFLGTEFSASLSGLDEVCRNHPECADRNLQNHSSLLIPVVGGFINASVGPNDPGRPLGIASATLQTIGMGLMIGGLVARFLPAPSLKTAAVTPYLSPFGAGIVARF